MGYLGGIDSNSDDYAEKYRQFGEKVLANAKLTTAIALGKNIDVFPTDSNNSGDNSGNVDSCVIVNSGKSAVSKPQKEETTLMSPQKSKNSKKADISWVRDALSGSSDSGDMFSGVAEQSSGALAEEVESVEKAKNKKNNGSESGDTEQEITEYDINDVENAVANVKELSNASDDEGNGEPLQVLFEHDLEKGLHSSNFVGTNYKNDFYNNSLEHCWTAYSDNAYKSKKESTSIIFGGTFSYSDYIDKSEKEENSKNIDFNAYLFGKYKLLKDVQVGAGGLCEGNDGVYNIDANVGLYHEKTGLYAIAYNNTSIIPGLPVQSKMDVVAGIGQASGMLDPRQYDRDTSVQEISDVDNVAQQVESQERKSYESNGIAQKFSDTTVNFIYSGTDDNKRYGIKAGHIFRFTGKNNNRHAFVMPFGQVCSLKVDSHSGINYQLGAHAGVRADLASGWELKTKGVLEASGESVEGNGTTYTLLGNVNFKASNKKNFEAEASLGGLHGNTGMNCFYAETKLNYMINKYITLNVKGGYAKSKFGDKNSDLLQIGAGVKANF